MLTILSIEVLYKELEFFGFRHVLKLKNFKSRIESSTNKTEGREKFKRAMYTLVECYID
jgi:hypothetical protein